jgi:adenylate kinase family enzyme
MRIVIFGNSGSGKTTAAREITSKFNIPVLELDLIVWESDSPPSTRPADVVQAEVEKFCATHDSWVVEGCYGELVKLTLKWKPEMIFMNPGEAVCVHNNQNRPWEPHKFASKADQDKKMAFIARWISDYYKRKDEMSLHFHREMFDTYEGPKREVTTYGT